MDALGSPAAILLVSWLLILAVVVEAGVTNLVTAFRTLKAMRDDA